MKRVYVMFSSTHKATGQFIRAVTRFEYNHVSIGFSPTIDTWYSFARRFRSNPWSGGFVIETWSRLCDGGDIPVCICSCDIPDSKYADIQAMIKQFEEQASLTLYNYLGAAGSVLGLRVKVPYSFTCVEFVSECLGLRYVSIPELYGHLACNTVYQGMYLSQKELSLQTFDVRYFQPVPFFDLLAMDISDGLRLTRRYLHCISLR